eukprot:gene13359-biopygen13752
MVPKPGNPKELRLVIDYRLLNRQTVKDNGWLLASTVPMAPGDVEKTAFTTQMGSYEWLVMPQDLQNSPSQYQRRMQRALGHLPFVRIFIDDVVVFSTTVAEHYEHVKQLLLVCREKGVFLKRSKCQLLKSLRFLGHCISGADGCRPQHDKVAAVRDWPDLETVTHVRQFLGLAGYYRRFIHCFLEIAQPLTRLTKSDVPWAWGPMQQWAFRELKTALTSAPVLALPNIKRAADGSAPFVAQTDASGIALGGVLMQDNGDVAEEAIDMGETIALMNPKTYKGKKMPGLDLDLTPPPAPTAERTPAPSERVTRSKSKPGSVSPDSTPKEQDFKLVGDVLWRTTADRYQLVLGEDSPLREVVIRHAHESLSSGHTGRDKTLERVLRRFWWRGAADDVGSWVASCSVCQAVRPRATYPDGLLNPHSIPARSWQDVAVDFVTGLLVSERGNDAFAAFTCKLSKMVHIVPVNFGDSSAATVARIYFDSVWRLHGAPMKIISDRDPRFQDVFWQELMRLMGVKVARTPPYNPRSDGQAEHTNRVIEDMLSSFVDANVEDWDLYATNVEFAINDSRCESTGFTPFELVFGFSPLSQLDMILEAAQSTAGRRKGGAGTAHEVAAKFSSQLRDARQRLELAQQRQREQFDRRHGQREYAIEDLVWVEAKNLTEKVMDRSICRKLTKRWHGPVPVVERLFSDMQMVMPEADRELSPSSPSLADARCVRSTPS